MGLSLGILFAFPSFNPDKDTLHYLYSSVFQGFCALLGIILVMLGFNYDRLRKSRSDVWTEIDIFLKNLGATDVTSIDDAKDSARSWYERACLPEQKMSREKFDQVMKRHRKWERFQYAELVGHIGQFYELDSKFKKLPFDTVAAVWWLAVGIGMSILLIGSLDSVVHPFSSLLAIVTLTTVFVALIQVLWFFRQMVKILFGGGHIKGYKETGLPELNSEGERD